MSPTLVILAAWMWNRYWWLKQIDAFGPHGESIIDYSVYDAYNAWFRKVVYIIRDSFRDEFTKKIVSKLPDDMEVHLVNQPMQISLDGVALPAREKPWWVTHAMLMIEPVVSEPFAILNADDYYWQECFKKAYEFLVQKCTSNTSACVGYKLKNTLSDHGTVNRWICDVSEERLLLSVQEHYAVRLNGWLIQDRDWKTLDPESVVSMNFRCFHNNFLFQAKEVFDQFVIENKDNPRAECPIPNVVDVLVHANSLICYNITTNDQWCWVTNPQDKQIVREMFDKLVRAWVYSSPLSWTVRTSTWSKTLLKGGKIKKIV